MCPEIYLQDTHVCRHFFASCTDVQTFIYKVHLCIETFLYKVHLCIETFLYKVHMCADIYYYLYNPAACLLLLWNLVIDNNQLYLLL